MLVEETVAYTKLLVAEGFSDKSNAYKEAVINLPAIIKAKQDSEKKATQSISIIVFTKDNTQPFAEN